MIQQGEDASDSENDGKGKQKAETKKEKNTWKKESKAKLSFNEQKEFNTLENEIKKLTIQKKETEELFNNANLNQDEIQEASKKLQKIISDIENKEDRWLELSMKLEDA